MLRSVKAEELKPGMKLALPMGKTATITEAKVGTRFVNLRTAEYGKSRVERYSEQLIEEG
jgi:hypothetical protein